jgi:hypothetical protein
MVRVVPLVKVKVMEEDGLPLLENHLEVVDLIIYPKVNKAFHQTSKRT